MSLRVLYPYAHPRRPITLAGVGAVEADVTGDPHNYWRLMCAEWERAVETGDNLLIVEHDVICTPEAVEAFEACPEPWCLNPYDNVCHPECMEAWANMLGCTRFSNQLIRAVPHAVSSIPIVGHDYQGKLCDLRDWHNLCDSIAGNKVGGMPSDLRPGSLRHAGFTHHWHHPGVHHVSWDRHTTGEVA